MPIDTTDTNTRADTLNQAAAHDTALNDPNVHENQIVAMYETDAAAHSARDQLVSAGVPSSAVHVVDHTANPLAGAGNAEYRNEGFWGALKSLFVPDEDAHFYAEGIRRGHAMVVVTPSGQSNRKQIIDVLDHTHPIDFDTKLAEWRQAGYKNETGYADETGSGEGLGAAAGIGASGAALARGATLGPAGDPAQPRTGTGQPRKDATDRVETVRDTVRDTEVEMDDERKGATGSGTPRK